jgi:hypothetical protein
VIAIMENKIPTSGLVFAYVGLDTNNNFLLGTSYAGSINDGTNAYYAFSLCINANNDYWAYV